MDLPRDCQLTDLSSLYTPLPPSPRRISPSRISKPRSPSKKPPPPKVFVCSSPSCGKRFSKKWNLQAHERLHTGSTPFVCRLGCGEAYMWMSSRKGHELNRCKYAIKKKNNTRGSVQNTRERTAANSAPISNTASAFKGTSDGYVPPALPLDRIHSNAISKDSDPLIVLEESLECLSNVSEDVLEKEEPYQIAGDSTMLMDADLVLADISLPDTDIFTDDFLEWLMQR